MTPEQQFLLDLHRKHGLIHNSKVASLALAEPGSPFRDAEHVMEVMRSMVPAAVRDRF